MDQDHRMECLRMAFELGGKTEPIVSAARQLLDFVHAKEQQAAEVNAEQAPAEPPAIEVLTSPEEPQPAAEAIAACGTAMVMPEGGELADAVPGHEASQELPSAAEPTQQPEASTEASASAEGSASTNEPCEASATETSQATAPSADPESQTPASEGAAEQPASEASSAETSSDGEATPRVEDVETVAAVAMQASPASPAIGDAVAVADRPEVSQ